MVMAAADRGGGGDGLVYAAVVGGLLSLLFSKVYLVHSTSYPVKGYCADAYR